MGWESMFNSIMGSGGGGTAYGPIQAAGSGAANLGIKELEWELLGKDISQQAYDRAMYSSALQFQREYDVYKQRYYDTTKDMKAAGLNPILAATGGFNIGSTPHASNAAIYQGPYPTSSARDLESLSNIGLTMGQTEKAKAETGLALKKADESMANAIKLRSESGLLKEQENLTFQKYWNARKEFVILSAELRKVQSQTELNDAQKKQAQAAATNMMFQAAELARTAEVYKTGYGEALKFVSETMKSMNVGFNFGGVMMMKGK